MRGDEKRRLRDDEIEKFERKKRRERRELASQSKK